MRIEGDSGRGLDVGAGETRLMGVVNVTPDSFFDGGKFASTQAAVDHGLRLLDEGADVLDIGGESTRPGHAEVAVEEQLARVVGVVEGLRARAPDAPISIDTTRARVAAESLDAGADWVNDTTALQADAELAPLVAERGCPVVLMHRFEPARAADSSTPTAVVDRIVEGLDAALARALAAGIRRDRVVLDPGIGFGTQPTDNDAICAHVDRFRRLGCPLLFGPSRKSFLGFITGKEAADRLCATAAAVATLALGGVEIVRVHDVAEMRDVVRVADAFRKAGASMHGGNG